MSEITDSLYKPFVINYRHLNRQHGVNMLLGNVGNVVFIGNCDKPQKEISKNCVVSMDCIIKLMFKSRFHRQIPLHFVRLWRLSGILIYNWRRMEEKNMVYVQKFDF